MIFLITLIAVGAATIFLVMYLPERKKNRDREPPPNSMEELCERVRSRINGLILDPRDESDEERTHIMRAVREACLGDRSEREYLKDRIKSMIIEMTGDRYGRGTLFIPFDEPERMSPLLMFEHMYICIAANCGRDVFAGMVSQYGWEGKSIITSGDIRKAYGLSEGNGGYNEMLDTLVQRVYEILYGHDCTDLLINDTSIDGVSAGVGGRTRLDYDYISELESGNEDISSRSFDTVYCVFEGRTVRLKFLSFGNGAALERVVKNIYRYNSRAALSQKDPVIHATMKDNSRVMVSRPPVSDGYTFYVRKYRSSSPADIRTLLVHNGAEDVIEILTTLVRTEQSFCISGNTGGGKTTLLKSLVAYIDPLYSIRVVESSFELDLNNLYPERNIHMLQERGDFSIYDAITATKKMDTDVLLIGEVNEPRVAGAFIQISQSGSRMAITTLHHESTKKLIEYMRNALMCEFGITDAAVAEKQVVDSIGFDVHMVRDTQGRHYVERITRIIPLEASGPPFYELKDIIVFDPVRSCYVKKDEMAIRGMNMAAGGG
ncbi:MAG: CpaF/VirB11 family protein [Lachnospiraceae bacterium]|nr:CpaF/VirB11 family protein [Lachnospiraceae bacterium]